MAFENEKLTRHGLGTVNRKETATMTTMVVFVLYIRFALALSKHR